ncbi:CoA-binding protein [Chlamydoabsidia padenii]|nr:CoA-binding protein [Chlamydoabsidia padenii]
MTLADQFIKNPYFAVLGASTSRTKYGNKVLRWYQTQGLNVTPVHPKETEIESIRTVASMDELEYPQQTSVSVITPPHITLQVLKDCKRLGISNIWLQPGAENKQVLDYGRESGLHVIAGGPCILVDGPSLLKQRGSKL